MMDGIQPHWLRSPDTVDLVTEWETAAETPFAQHPARTRPEGRSRR